MKEGGSGHTQSTFSNPEALGIRTSSPLIPERHNDTDFLSRQPMEEVGNIEVTNFLFLKRNFYVGPCKLQITLEKH
jgi:hypothetical protein